MQPPVQHYQTAPLFSDGASQSEMPDRGRLERDGYLELPAFMADKLPRELDEALSELAGVRLHPWHSLAPTRKDQSTPNAYSGMYGFEQFPLHTDLAHWRKPPRFVALRCVRGHESVSTILVDGRNVVPHMESDVVNLAIVVPRRPRNGKLILLKLHKPTSETSSLLRWDEGFLRPANKYGEIAMASFHQALRAAPVLKLALKNPGDTIVFDNWRMLHGRDAVPDQCADRLIMRAYLGEMH